MSLKLDKHYDLSKHVIILTGASDGIGKEMARILSGFNPKRLILPVRNKTKGNSLLEYIKSSNNGSTKNSEIWEMDLADLESVKNFANKFIIEVGELHMLFNNAGFTTGLKIVKTKDNLESQFQVNYLAPFLLTLLLLDTMKRSVSVELPGKIAFTISSLNSIGEIDFDNLNLEKGGYWNPMQVYANTKLMDVIISKELSRRLQNENIKTYSLHPGVIKSNANSSPDFLANFILTVVMTFGKTTEQGAINILYPVLSPENKETGKYYNEGVEMEPIKIVNDNEVAKKLWNVSEQMLRDRGMI